MNPSIGHPICLAIIDDYEPFRKQAMAAIKRMPVQHFILNCSATATEFLKFLSEAKVLPDIAMVDVQMTGMDGVSITQFLSLYYPEIKVIALSGHEEREIIEAMVKQGAVGYLSKTGFLLKDDTHLTYMQQAIDSALVNELYIDPLITRYGKEHITAASINRQTLLAEAKQAYEKSMLFDLTKNDRMVLLLKAAGITNRNIAEIVRISDSTLERKLTSINQKLAVNNHSELITQAIRFRILNIADIRNHITDGGGGR